MGVTLARPRSIPSPVISKSHELYILRPGTVLESETVHAKVN